MINAGGQRFIAEKSGDTTMKILVACEFSGVVRDAFARRGHDVISCDLLPSEKPGRHVQCDVSQLLTQRWDMIIAFPPCTYLCNSGVRWLYGGKGNKRDVKRWEQMQLACLFFRRFINHPTKRLCIENPIMHRHARELIGYDYSQSIQPWQFGHGEIKRTCLWLRGLPALVPTDIVTGRIPRVHHASPDDQRWKERSRTLPGIADAMAEQWSDSRWLCNRFDTLLRNL